MRRLRAKLSGHSAEKQLVRFLLVGLGNTGVGYLLFVAFVLVGFGSQVALALAFLLGVLWNFWTHARIVFGQGALRRLPAYGGVYLAIWGANAWALGAAERAGVPPLLAQAGLAPLAAVASFFLIARVLTGRFPVFGTR